MEKNYVFDSPSGKKTLADLFEGKSQLIVYHFMFGPDWSDGVRAKEVVIPSFLRAATDFLTYHGPLKSDIGFCVLKFKGMH